MEKEVIRKQAIRLRFRYKSYALIQSILKERYSFVVSRRTLKRWWHRFNAGDWNFRDVSRKPKTVKYKFSQEEIDEILFLRKQEGCSAYQIKYMLEKKGFYMSESFIKSIIKTVGLSRGNKMEGQRLKWVRFERLHPNSMWQIDGTQYKGKWIIPVIDDCSRYCIIIGVFEQNTTKNIVALLERAIQMHEKPREILTDNGSEFGGTGKGKNQFDKWCKKRGIEHIRSRVHKPTTVGKISRIQFTIMSELPYCKFDLSYFRWRYNTLRPHRSLNGLTPQEVYFEQKRHKKYLLNNKQIITGV